VLAAAVRLMDETLIRIGNEEYERQNHSYGITTLHDEHVHLDGDTMQFEFRAKSGKEQHVRLRDPLLARILYECEELPGQELFRYVDDHGHVVHVDSADVNAYLHAATAATFTAKDFRTWGGSVTAADALVGLGPPRSPTDAKRKIVSAIDAAAARLNNTRAVARKSYVHPRVPESWEEGALLDAFAHSEASEHLSASEAGLLGVIADEPR
jgi:DNA topoisomerase-1